MWVLLVLTVSMGTFQKEENTITNLHSETACIAWGRAEVRRLTAEGPFKRHAWKCVQADKPVMT